jgi:isoquinoline 1-oxidoreductase
MTRDLQEDKPRSSRSAVSEFEIEPERYELHEPPAYHFDFDRRDFFKVFGSGILVTLVLPVVTRSQESGTSRRGGGGMPKEIGAWIHIGEDGMITAYTGKVEVGQGARTELTQVVAEELRVSVESVKMVMGDTDLTPYDMGTFGSMTTPQMAPQIRKASAAARELLIDIAAERWRVTRDQVSVSNGKVSHSASKRSLEFKQLTSGQKIAKTIADDVPATPAAEWKVQGQPIAKVGGRDIVTGKHRYSSDVKRPGMLVGKILRPSSLNATLVSADTKQAEAMAGVTVVRDGELIGVAAPDEHTAAAALAAIKAEWKSSPQPSSAGIFDYLKKNPTQGQGRGGGNSRNNSGSIEEGLAAADKKLQQTYNVAYIAHVPLEPRAAVAEWNGDKLTVWTGTQRPFGVRSELAQTFRIPEDRVRVIMPDTGSGYGGKHTGEAAIEAARLARVAAKPVRVVWTREEEFTWAYFRPAGVIDVSSGVRNDGAITAWEFHNYNSGSAGIRGMYDVANQKIEFHGARSPLRQGSYRALASTANHFARETHLDELAHLVKLDPLELRLKNLKDTRLRAVLEAAAKRFGWGKSKPAAGRGFGIAGGFEKGAYVATCAEVAVDRTKGTVVVMRAVTAFECGAIINPDNLRNQIEGSVIQGLGGALFESVEFENGKILNPRLSSYRVPRFSDSPPLETVLLDRKDLPSSGSGETPIVCIAPAVGNAIFDATGIRLRSLPLATEALKQDRARS